MIYLDLMQDSRMKDEESYTRKNRKSYIPITGSPAALPA